MEELARCLLLFQNFLSVFGQAPLIECNPVALLAVDLYLPRAGFRLRLAGIRPVIGSKHPRQAMLCIVDHFACLGIEGQRSIFDGTPKFEGVLEHPDLIGLVSLVGTVFRDGSDATPIGKVINPFDYLFISVDPVLMAKEEVRDLERESAYLCQAFRTFCLFTREAPLREERTPHFCANFLRLPEHLCQIVDSYHDSGTTHDIDEHVPGATVSLVSLIEQQVCFIDECNVYGMRRIVLVVDRAILLAMPLFTVLVDELGRSAHDNIVFVLKTETAHDGVIDCHLLLVVDKQAGIDRMVLASQLIHDAQEKMAQKYRLACSCHPLYDDEGSLLYRRFCIFLGKLFILAHCLPELCKNRIFCFKLLLAQRMEGRCLEYGRIPDDSFCLKELRIETVELPPDLRCDGSELRLRVVVILRVSSSIHEPDMAVAYIA